MTQGESLSGKYNFMPMGERHQLALADPAAAREMALGGFITLTTPEGYRAIEERVKQDLATVLGKQRAIGESYAADPDEMENAEQQYLKAEIPAYARALAESRQMLNSAVVYSEELPGRISFGSKFAASIQYPGREEPTTRQYLLLGPGETFQKQGKYEDEGGQYTVVSYLSPVGSAFWGASIEEAAQQHLSIQLPTSPDPAIILSIDLHGKVK